MQAHVQELALSAAGPFIQRHQDGDGRIEPGRQVHDRRAHPQGAGAVMAVDGHQPDHRLDDRVVAGQAAERTFAAEAGDAAMDQTRKALRQHIGIADAPFLHAAGLVVLDQHIGAFQQSQQHRAAFRLREIEGEGALVAVDADVVAGVALMERRAPAARLVALGGFDLDHLRAVIRQDHRAIGTAQHARQVDDLEAGQRAGGCGEALALGHGNGVGHAACFLYLGHRFRPPALTACGGSTLRSSDDRPKTRAQNSG